MGWVDRALATLRPADVADRVSSYVQNTQLEESYAALRRALVRMPAADLAQLAMAFDIPLSTRDVSSPFMFDEDPRQTAVLAHFLTIPTDFKSHLETFLQTNPRAIGYFDDSDAEQMLQLRRPSNRIDVQSPAVVIVASALVALVGLALGAWFAVLTHKTANQQTRVAAETVIPASTPTTIATATPVVTNEAPTPVAKHTATPAPVIVVTSTPLPQVKTNLEGTWQIGESNVIVGSIVWAGNAVLSRGNTMVFNLRKQLVGGRSAMPCERQTVLSLELALDVPDQTAPYHEVNCQGVSSSGEVHVTSFSRRTESFSGTFWQDGKKLGDFAAHKQ